MSLFDALSQIAEQITQHKEVMVKSEATVEQVSVLPFINALGFDTYNPAEVRRQYAILNWDAVDFAILQNNEPIMVLEAKKSSETLSKHWKQLFQYFNADKAQIGILTDGVQYRLYTDSVKQNIMDDEPFLVIDLDVLDKISVSHLEGFTKANFHPAASPRKVIISNLLKSEIQKPSDNFVKYFARQVHSGAIWQTVVEEYRPIIKRAWDEFIEREISLRLPGREKAEEENAVVLPRQSEIDKPVRPVSSSDSNYIPVFGHYEGHRFEAQLLRKSINDGLTIAGNQICYDGKTTWLKNAAVMAIRSVDPSFEPTRTYPNGFEFWHVVDPDDGQEHKIRFISGWDMTDESLRARILCA